MKITPILPITIFLLQFSCSNNIKIEDKNVYSLGVFYANNKKNSKDISNHFQNNCHFLLLLKHGEIEIYNRESANPQKKRIFSKIYSNCKRTSKFIRIINNQTKRNKQNPIPGKNYCGNTYVCCVENIENSIFYISEYDIKEQDEIFIFTLIEKAQAKNRLIPSNKLIKEKYFTLGLLHQESIFTEIKRIF